MIELLFYPYGGLAFLLMAIYIKNRPSEEKFYFDIIGLGLPLLLLLQTLIVHFTLGFFFVPSGTIISGRDVVYISAPMITLISCIYSYWIGKNREISPYEIIKKIF